MVKTEIFTALQLFGNMNNLITILYRLYAYYHQTIFILSSGYLQVFLYKDHILTICRLLTDYIQVLHKRKIGCFGTEIHLFLLEKNAFFCTEPIVDPKLVVDKSILYLR